MGMQVLSVVTVGNDQDGLSQETALGTETSNFISHFTCPSFAINEVCCSAHGSWKIFPSIAVHLMYHMIFISKLEIHAALSLCSSGVHSAANHLASAMTMFSGLPCSDRTFAAVQMKARHGHMKRVEVEGGRLLRMALSSQPPITLA